MRTFNELKTEVGRMVQRSADADYLTKIGVWLNLSQDFLYNVYDWWTELQDVHNFTTVDGTGDYFMPNNFDKPLRVYDLTNNRRLTIDTEQRYFDANITNVADSNEGIPQYARIYGVSGVTTQVATTGDTLQVKSSSDSDTGSITVRVEGYIDSGLLITGYETITVSVATPTTYVAGTTTFYKILHVSKSGNTVGYITLADSSSNVLAYLGATDRVMMNKVMKLGLIPDDAYDMRTLFKKKHNILVNTDDYCFTDADDFLILNSAGYALSQDREPEKAQFMFNKSREALNGILSNVIGKMGTDYQHKMTSNWALAHRI